MRIEQYEDKNLSHYSYLIEDNGEMIIIDPSRNPLPYLDAARSFEAQIKGIILTHRHADFVSSHVELQQLTGATIYIHNNFNDPQFSHQKVEDGTKLEVGVLDLEILYTPGHTPDSICILLSEESDNKPVALFTGDTLFIGDCGRPDLFFAQQDSSTTDDERNLAEQLYHSLEKIKQFGDDVYIYPAHGAGSLCGTKIADDDRSTIGEEKITNWSLRPQTVDTFVTQLLEDLPYVPLYFGHAQQLNSKGAPNFQESIDKVTFLRDINSEDDLALLNNTYVIVDCRDADDFKRARLSNSINIPNGKLFETWLGSIIAPGQRFYLAGNDADILLDLIERSAKIGYEMFIENILLLDYGVIASPKLRLESVLSNPDDYTILDVRHPQEIRESKTIPQAVNIPLQELQNRLNEVPTEKPIVVHCAGGYRSAIASSILEKYFKEEQIVLDMGSNIKDIIEEP